MTSLRGSLLVLPIAIVLAACGDMTTPPAADAGGGSDMSASVDGNVPDGAGPDDAGAVPDADIADAGGPTDMCAAPGCPPIPPGCRLEPSSNPCLCGEIKCDDGGVAGAACGGRAGPCAPTLYCDFTAAFDCGFADGMGTCMPRPDICPGLFAPVCGCDGMTYSNLCVAHSMGVDSAADGVCAVGPPPPPPPPRDCRSMGCPPGNYCAECRGIGGAIWVCLPDGSVC